MSKISEIDTSKLSNSIKEVAKDEKDYWGVTSASYTKVILVVLNNMIIGINEMAQNIESIQNKLASIENKLKDV